MPEYMFNVQVDGREINATVTPVLFRSEYIYSGHGPDNRAALAEALEKLVEDLRAE